MQELLPPIIGMVLGGILCAARVRPRIGQLLTLGILGGVVSTTVNGEWAGGVAPLLTDALSALLATGTVLTIPLAFRRLRHRRIGTSECT
jgi:hypothetical protein